MKSSKKRTKEELYDKLLGKLSMEALIFFKDDENKNEQS
jgi:hypothetical protein